MNSPDNNKTVQDFNDEPVLYCKRCLSLLIMEDECVGDYCPECGSTDVGETQIEEWEKLYKKKYNKNF